MKIGILTQPLYNNYGGLLQCYALMQVLKKLGHEPELISRIDRNQSSGWLYNLYNLTRHYASCILKRRLKHRITTDEKEFIAQYTSDFINRYITPRSPFLFTSRQIREYVERSKFDAFIVGSDQCWRPMYSPCITDYFLGFLPKTTNNYKCLAYAASFGVDEWEFNSNETQKCASLAKKFNGISVRESSGIELCRKNLGVQATHVLDPTMLLEVDDYRKLVTTEEEPQSAGRLFYYILDKNVKKQEVVNYVSETLHLKPFTAMPKCLLNSEKVIRNLKDCVFPPVTQWLRSFMDAEMVVTDSFHGCVFSIIFNKPFWVIGNKERGLSRFHSLLSMYGLQERLIIPENMTSFDCSTPINWEEINQIRKDWQKLSYEFLIKNLS